jgi:hypothetical protein
MNQKTGGKIGHPTLKSIQVPSTGDDAKQTRRNCLPPSCPPFSLVQCWTTLLTHSPSPLDGLQVDKEADGLGIDEDMIVTQSQTNFICPITQVSLPPFPGRKCSELHRGKKFLFAF